MSSVKAVSGKVTLFDVGTASGQVRVASGTIGFDSTCFQSGRPTRFPIAGEPVTVVYSEGMKILAIRAKSAPGKSSAEK